MYAKIFSQIFDSSIAENYEVRHVFEDLLKLADVDGVVDMTAQAISRRTNVPLEKIQAGIAELLKPDEHSRSKISEGRRLVPLDSGRDWGWIIVNYQHYRDLQDEASRRLYFRDAKRRQRAADSTQGMNGKQKAAYHKGRSALRKRGETLKESEIIGRKDQLADALEVAGRGVEITSPWAPVDNAK